MKYLKKFENINWDFINEEIPDFYPKTDNWCIKITDENKPILQQIDKNDKWKWEKGYNYTVGAYYWKDRGSWDNEGKEIIDFDIFLELIKNK